jgi:hypothetical protein
MIYQSCFSSVSDLFHTLVSSYTFNVFLLCILLVPLCHIYVYIYFKWECVYVILLFTESERIKFEMVLNTKKKGVIHMVNMSFFLTTCSVIEEEKYRLYNSIWFGLIVNCAQEKQREGETFLFYFPSLFQ